MTMQPPEILLTPKEVKGILKCSLPQVYKMADKGVIGCVRMPSAMENGGRGMVRFKQSDVLAFIERNHRKAIGDS